MSRCKQCNIEVLDETERCPLCHSVLEPTIEVVNMYPDVKIKTRRMMLLSRIYLFVAIVAEAVLVVVNHYGDFETAWSLVTGLIFFYGYLVVRFAILGKTGYIAKTIVLTLIAILILIAIDFVNGYRDVIRPSVKVNSAITTKIAIFGYIMYTTYASRI